MLKMFSFRIRLLLFLWPLLFLMLLLPSWYYFSSLKREILAEAQRNAIQKLDYIHWSISQEMDFRDAEHLQRWLVDTGRQMALRITYMAEGGRVIADSQVPFAEIPNMDNHASRPEIMQARRQEVGLSIRYSGTLQENQIYVAKSIVRKGAIPSGVIRLAIPFANVKERFDRLTKGFLAIILVTLMLSGLLGYGFLRLFVFRLHRALQDVTQGLHDVANRNYQRRIPFYPGQELHPLAEAFNRMAEQVDAHFGEISSRMQQYGAIFDAMQDAVMILDSRGRIQSFNHTFKSVFCNTVTCVGRQPLEIIMNLELQEACDRVLSSPPESRPGRHSLEIVLRGENTYDVDVVRFQDRQHKPGVVVTLHDITKLKRLERTRQDFVANVSHELRTPLTSIKGYTETLLGETETDPASTASFLQIILKNANHMVKMVDDLLQLARLEAHQRPVQPVAVNVREALLAAWKACAPMAETGGVHLKNELPEEGIEVLADPGQLVQVFRNLLENGIKYSPSGREITVSCQKHDEKVTFSVRDEGPGIPKQYQRRIFERFYRVEKHRQKYTGSTGLGLAICRHIIGNWGGTIWVRSPNESDAKGSTFCFTLFLAGKDGQE